MIAVGLDRLLEEPVALDRRPYALLAHAAAVSASLEPAHLALARRGSPPALLLAPEHGFYGVEQDMVASSGGNDPWTGVPILSLYGSSESSLRPDPEVFGEVDLLVVDLQDVGTRYYTYAATAVWAVEAALGAGLEVWLLDRPNPLGGEVVEGNLRRPGFESFVGAFALPVRHGLTLGELVRLEARRRRWPAEALRVWTLEGWRREMTWPATGRPWLPPSPNLPTFAAALVYPGTCLVEGTTLSEGRGTTWPFRLVGAPGIDALALTGRLDAAELPGVRFMPAHFRPQFQKHAGEVCCGVRLVVTHPQRFPAYRCGVELLAAVAEVASQALEWRPDAYEFVTDRPALDLLAGDDALRSALESGDGLESWLASWEADEEAFRRERREVLLYRQGSA